MGTAISIDVVSPADTQEDVAELIEAAFAWFREVDARFSTYKPASEVSRIDRIPASERSDDLRHVQDACARLWEFTGGYFDAYATGRFDPSGYVKGWSVQAASDRLAAAGALDHCINAGGDVCVRGRPAAPSGTDGDDGDDGDDSGPYWRIGVRHPWEERKLAWVLGVTDTAVATSGTYERGLHVIDPFTGQGAHELRSVTVVGPDLALADAYATAALAMGRAGLAWLGRLDGYESAVITEDGRAYASDGLPVLG
ncbi:FAD:protein FMN transferase [Hamadaea tsunoensis]|uniref:FAD:protein FMN transferase n=1 Tax=Hamadaea tsunoensis TaxID=53368 RepID=UPI000485D1E2|nr:FAD:protein FMN transferase [Hamadaea tsunoensis]